MLRLINLSKKKVNKTTFRIGDEEETNIGDQVNADHLKEQLTTVTTVKVRIFYLGIFRTVLLYFVDAKSGLGACSIYLIHEKVRDVMCA